MHRLKAPTANGAVLAEPGFDAIPALIEANRKLLDTDRVAINGISLRDLRTAARREVLKAAGATATDSPLLLAGHQPELSHPGVWVKNFALNGLAKQVGGVPLNLIVDNDTLKNASLRVPRFHAGDPHSVHLETIRFDTFSGDLPYEGRRVEDGVLFDSFADRAASIWSDWGFDPLLRTVWPEVVHQKPTALIGERFTAARTCFERKWGCNNWELSVSQLSKTESFRRFAIHIISDLPRFRAAYNSAIQGYRKANRIRSANHPAPELATHEAPFWEVAADGRRKPVSAVSHRSPAGIRPRALTLTLFARLCLGDFFIHGIGGGKYDEVTDAIIRDYFGIEPPAYQVLSATLHLPLPGFASTKQDVDRAARLIRDLQWNPQRYIPPEALSDAHKMRLVAARMEMAEAEPPFTDRPARREWFRYLQNLNEKLRPFVEGLLPAAHTALERVSTEVRANAVLQRRDYAWVLYPEATLRPYLQRFLEV